jgi:hypothetical protein
MGCGKRDLFGIKPVIQLGRGEHEQKGRIMKLTALVIVIAILVLGVPVAAQVPAHIEYDFSGVGNLMVSPVVYAGSIDTGEPLLVGGTWTISIDDAGWPGDSDKAARWSYIDATYFTPNFNPFVHSWTGVFNARTTASAPQWRAGRPDVGDLVGTADVQFTIEDFDSDNLIDPDERMMMVVSGTFIVVKNGTGIWAGQCGLGSYSGYTENMDPWNWADDAIMGGTALDIEDCSVPTQTVTWGHVKATYGE